MEAITPLYPQKLTETDSAKKTSNLQGITLRSRVYGLPQKFAGCGFKNYEAYNERLEKAKQICDDVAHDRTEKKSIVLSGTVGVGKSHLAIATLRNLVPVKMQDKRYGAYREASGYFIMADEFFMRLTDASFVKRSKLELMNEWLSYDVFCLDDLGIKNFTDAKQENLYVFINKAYLEGKAIILTTNFTLDDIAKFDERIPSRLVEMAEIITLNGDDYRLRNATSK